LILKINLLKKYILKKSLNKQYNGELDLQVSFFTVISVEGVKRVQVLFVILLFVCLSNLLLIFIIV